MNRESRTEQPYPALDDLIGRDPEALNVLAEQSAEIVGAARSCRAIFARLGWGVGQLDAGIAEVQALHDNCVRARELARRGDA